MNNHRSRLKMLALVLGIVFLASSAYADESVENLKKQVEELKAKVAALESDQARAVPAWGAHTGNPVDAWDPMAEMSLIHGQMQRMFQQAFDQGAGPHQGMFSNQLFFDDSMIEEKNDGYVIKLDTTGFDKDKIDIKAQEGSLTISGEYKSQEKRESQGGIMESHQMGRFLNSIPLPVNADVANMKTEKKQNMLEVFIPKKK